MTNPFRRFQRKERISDVQLVQAIADAERGLINAELGSGLIKQRVARPGQGKSGGYRTLIAFRSGQRSVFLFGFAKRERENISDAQLEDLRAIATDLLNCSDEGLDVEVAAGRLQEVDHDESN